MMMLAKDIIGYLLAVTLVFPVVVLPGYLIAWGLNIFSARIVQADKLFLLAILCGFVALPVLSSLTAMAFSLTGALYVHGVLAVAGAVIAWRAGFPKMRVGLILVGLLWLVAIGYLYVDFVAGDQLWESLVVVDLVKHAATIKAMAGSNSVPPLDVFYIRDQPAGYYYYFYIAGAMIYRIAEPVCDARMIFAGLAFWASIAVVEFLFVLDEKTGLRKANAPTWPILAVLPLSGLYIIFAALVLYAGNKWVLLCEWWTTDTVSSPIVLSLIWVPHHVLAGVAISLGLMALIDTALAYKPSNNQNWSWSAICFAGLCFATAAGLSIWVTLVGVVGIIIWLLLAFYERHWHHIMALMMAGLLSISLSIPYLWGLLIYRMPGPFPIGFRILDFAITKLFVAPGLMEHIAELILLPVNLFIQFGVFLVAMVMFVATPQLRRRFKNPQAKAILILALSGVFIGCFFASVIRNNDLGYRAWLFWQFLLVLCAGEVIHEMQKKYFNRPAISFKRGPVLLVITAVLGVITTSYDFISMRFNGGLEKPIPYVDNRTFYDLRQGYEWLLSTKGIATVTQHNPTAKMRFAYGLYGPPQVALSDQLNSVIFGASQAAVDKRMKILAPVFNGILSAEQSGQRLQKLHVKFAVVSKEDPVWHMPRSWVWTLKPVFSLDRVRIYDVAKMTLGVNNTVKDGHEQE